MIKRLEQAARRPVSRETFEKLEAYVALLREESGRQNLIAASTLEQIWDACDAAGIRLSDLFSSRTCPQPV